MRHYESVFILNPALSEDQVKDAIKKYEKFLKSNGAKLVHKENWGLKKLAYPIQKKSTGFYFLFEFDLKHSSKFLKQSNEGHLRANLMSLFIALSLPYRGSRIPCCTNSSKASSGGIS